MPPEALQQPYVEYRYDTLGNLRFETGPRDLDPDPNVQSKPKTSYQYDKLGRRTKVMLQDTEEDGHPAPVTEYVYDPAGQLKQIRTPGAGTDAGPVTNVTDYAYDNLGRLTLEQQPLDADHRRLSTRYTYDLRDNIVTTELLQSPPYESNVFLSTGIITQNVYDNLDRLIAIDYPDREADESGQPPQPGLVTLRAYLATGELDRELVFAGQLDPDTRLEGTAGHYYVGIDPANPEADTLASVQASLAANAPFRLTRYQTDRLGRVTRVTSPDPDGTGPRTSTQTDFEYDRNGNVIKTHVAFQDLVSGVWETRVQHTEVGYDYLNRPYYVYGPANEVRPAEPRNPASLFVPPEQTTIYNLDGTVWKQKVKNALPIQTVSQATWRTTVFTYDALGRLYQTTSPAPEPSVLALVSYSFQDPAGNMVLRLEPSQPPVTLTYDVLDRVATTTTRISTSDATTADITTTNAYYADGSLRQQINSAIGTEPHVRYQYDPRGVVTQVSETNGSASDRITTYHYDVLGRRDSVEDSNDSETTFYYDNLGQLRRQYMGGVLAKRQYRYDAFGNLVQAIDGNRQTIEYAYDYLGQRTDERWFDTASVYSQIGQIPYPVPSDGSVADPYHATFAYTGLGELVLAEDERRPDGSPGGAYAPQSEYTFAYDGFRHLNLVTQQLATLKTGTNPTPVVSFAIESDVLGNRTKRTVKQNDDELFRTSYGYDDLNRMTLLQQQGGAAAPKSVEFDYRGADLEWVWRYDTFAPVVLDQVSFSHYERLADGRLSHLPHKGAVDQELFFQTLSYDEQGRVEQMDTRWEGVEFPTRTYTYDDLHQLTDVDTAGQPQDHQEFNYDAAGNRRGATEPYNRVRDEGLSGFDYDDEGNVIGHWRYQPEVSVSLTDANTADSPPHSFFSDLYRASVPGGLKLTGVGTNANIVVTISLVGTPESRPLTGSAVRRTGTTDVYDVTFEEGKFWLDSAYSDKVLSVAISFPLLPDAVVQEGTVQLDQLATFQAYTWDHYNQLKTATVYSVPPSDNPSHPEVKLAKITYEYDVLGNRIGKRIDGLVGGQVHPVDDVMDHEEYYVAEDGHLLLEYDAQRRLVRQNVYAQAVDQLLAVEDFSYTGETMSSQRVIWTLPDHQGSITELYAEGATPESLKYDAFGSFSVTGGGSSLAASVKARYTGREYDQETGLYYYRARYYDPLSGRFLSPDPLGFAAGDTNLYRYAGNSPTNARDPSGLASDFSSDPFDWVGGFYQSLGGAIASTNPEFFATANPWMLAGGTVAFATGVVLTGGALGYATGAGFVLGAAGASASFYGGLLQTYAADSQAGIVSYAFAGGMGMVFGGMSPGGGFGTLGGTFAGAGVGGYMGNASRGAQWGGAIGGFIGGGVQDVLRRGWSKSWQALAWQGGGGVAFGTTAYAMTGDADRALFWANMGQMAGGIVHGGIGLYNQWRASNIAADALMAHGRRGGQLYGDTQLAKLERYLLRRKINVVKNADEFLNARGANSLFRPYHDGSATIFLRANPTRYEVLHELQHFIDFGNMGRSRSPWLNWGETAWEQSAYSALHRNRNWVRFSQGEIDHAFEYILRVGGNPFDW